MNREIKVSIIIPVYNVEQYLRQCLDSVVNQTLKDIEIICIDDYSSDNSLQILEEYAKKDDRFIIIKNNNNLGCGVSRNKCLKIAKGEYIGFVDPDDWLETDMFEKLYNSAKENNSDIAISNYIRFDEETNTYKDAKYFRKIKDNYKLAYIKNIKPKHKKKEFLIENLLAMGMGVTYKIYKRSFIEDNNIKFQEIRYMEDVEFNLYAFLKVKVISYIDEILFYYRIRKSSIMRSDKDRTDESFEVFDNIYRILHEEKKYRNFAFNFKFFIIFTLKRVAKKLNYFQKIRLYLKAKKYLDRNELSILKERIGL